MSQLVLSLFPGIGLLDIAFEEEGFCVVRGPDCLWGGDVRRFHPPAGCFDGVIGGPPCQAFSSLAHLVRANGHEPRFGNLIPEYERCVACAAPAWFLMENVRAAPEPSVPGYATHALLLNNAWLLGEGGLGQEQERLRRFTFGVLGVGPAPNLLRWIDLAALMLPEGGRTGAVTGSDGGKSARMARYTLADACRLQGLQPEFLAEAPFTAAGKLKAVANSVPRPMGLAIARAIKEATR